MVWGGMMYGPCPYPCMNKTELGYCRSTGCINPNYMYIVFYSNAAPEPCRNCLNNPINGGTGICHCILGNPVRY